MDIFINGNVSIEFDTNSKKKQVLKDFIENEKHEPAMRQCPTRFKKLYDQPIPVRGVKLATVDPDSPKIHPDSVSEFREQIRVQGHDPDDFNTRLRYPGIDFLEEGEKGYSSYLKEFESSKIIDENKFDDPIDEVQFLVDAHSEL
ncbi:MAG: hypothetical protein ACFFCS_28445, partial [Candidatus Hodarchaeota archaeon]